MAVYFTSDLHLGHENILAIRTRFKSIEEHDEFIIERFNKKVKTNDQVYFLGDLSFRASKSIEKYLECMRGRKHLIVGNHDHYWMRNVDDMSTYFETVESLKTIKFEKKMITLCHYPLLEWPGSRYVDSSTSYLIHGHIHGTREGVVFEHIRKYQPHALNAGIDVNNYEPVTFEELKLNCEKWYERDDSTMVRWT